MTIHPERENDPLSKMTITERERRAFELGLHAHREFCERYTVKDILGIVGEYFPLPPPPQGDPPPTPHQEPL